MKIIVFELIVLERSNLLFVRTIIMFKSKCGGILSPVLLPLLLRLVVVFVVVG